jgi:iron complex transport system ATP-binding protein
MIELQNVSLGYHSRAVVYDINLKTLAGEMLGLVGPNGSGKSTLIKGISGVVSLFSGTILVDGRNTRAMKREELARIVATVPQNPLLPAAFTAFEVVLMGRTPHLGLLRYEGKKDFAIAWRAMELTGTQSFAYRRISELSGGEQQRVVIARALAQEPKILLLDEPTAHLDISYQIEILDLIKSLCLERRLTVVIAVHDLNLASQYCDRIVLLNGGRIRAEGSPAQVLTAENIKQAYGANVCVFPHPINHLPVTFITPGAKCKESNHQFTTTRN